MEVMFLDITTSLSEVHPWNALFSIAVTVSGSITLVIAALFWNIVEPMVDTPLGMVNTPDIFAPLNVKLPTVAFLIISETTSGEIAPTPLNALLAMDVIALPASSLRSLRSSLP